jgi:hypothetical protein
MPFSPCMLHTHIKFCMDCMPLVKSLVGASLVLVMMPFAAKFFHVRDGSRTRLCWICAMSNEATFIEALDVLLIVS